MNKQQEPAPSLIGPRIKELRENIGITTNALALRAGISQTNLRLIEMGQKHPTIETVSLICEAMNITLADFFNEDTFKSLFSNELYKSIALLNPNQREKLSLFLKSLNE